MNVERLVTMANDISHFFVAEAGPDDAPEQIAAHLKKFWDPRMRAEIAAAVAEGRATGLDPIALAAVREIAAPRPN